ncbi:efflux RND transporter permease subunit [Ilumatobacter sp.]|uniref:efflux RND transporter permease subunit n=1 Tax=Ilumatobacter sp. TaxID=1967498 RepID=UPI003AF7D194
MTATLASIFDRFQRRPGPMIAVAAVITGLLLVPFLTMAPDTSASTEPSGDVFTARDRIDDSFVSSVHPTLVIVEAEGGDMLRAEALGGLLAAEAALRTDSELGATLFSYFDTESGFDVNGVLGLADLVDRELRASGVDGVAAASDAEVTAAGTSVIDRYGERSELLGISAQSQRTDRGWVVPAVTVTVLSDNEALGFGNTSVNLGGDTDVEEFDRQVQEVFRVDGLRAYGVAIDVNLTSQEQGAVAGPFIGFTILAVLLLVGITFRSYWVLATVGVAFLALIVWLKGISNLIGLEDDLVLSLIVPVAMISFGVDFAFHALGRYREERALGHTAGPAIVAGMTAVSAALLLALTSDATAFLANLTSGIPSITQFGLGAAIALAAAYLLLGIVTPFVVARIEADVPAPVDRRRVTVGRVVASVGAAGLSMTSVLLLVFILPWLGVVFAAATALITLVVPYLVQRRKTVGLRAGELPIAAATSRLATRIGRVVSALAARPAVVLPTAVAISAGAAVFAVQVPAEFDVEDFFSSDTDFVVGLDLLDEHVGDRGGEPALLYVEGDLSDPAALVAVRNRVDEIRGLDTDSLARDADGVQVDGGILEVLDAAAESDLMAGLVAQQTGVVVSDVDGDGLPDSREQVEAIVAVAGRTGVPFDATRSVLTPDDVNTAVVLGDDPRTVFEMGVVDSRAQESVTATRDHLTPIAEALSDDLGGEFVQVTGSALVREASLDATNRALQVSLPVALLLCFLVGSTFLRSLRYGLASIVPIMMVVAWLYAFMYVAGFAINLVTATIAAVSIGIGIDFAIHFIARYREELERHGSRATSVRIAGEGTGLALVASAVSSAVGFGILAFAPMPLFAAYGLLTALMILLALIATLAVLPAVLVAITSDVDTPTTVDDRVGRDAVLEAAGV